MDLCGDDDKLIDHVMLLERNGGLKDEE